MQSLAHLRRTAAFRRLSKIPVTIPRNSKETGYVIYVDLFRNLSFVVRGKLGPHERSFALLLDHFRPRIFWDVGANVGLYSMVFLSHNPDGTVLAFEPDQRNLDLLTRTVRRNALRSVKIVPKAVDRQSGEAVFFADDVTGQTGTIIPNHYFISSEYGATPSQTVVRTTTLDEQLCENEGPDLIKIDVEGADLAAIEGGRHMLECYLPVVVYESTKSTNIQTKKILRDLGYSLFDADTLQAIDAGGAYNILALHRQKHLGGQEHIILRN